MNSFPSGFEEREEDRSVFIHALIKEQLSDPTVESGDFQAKTPPVPRTLIRYWHDPKNLPEDVSNCLKSWDRLRKEGFEFRMYDDLSAAAYIEENFGERERRAFRKCRHPAMRCDYLRMCVMLAEGGVYVDADDVLVSDGWRDLFSDNKLKVQPLCFDISTGRMMPAAKIWQADLPSAGHVFYVNNDPIAAPAGHPVLRRAFGRATDKLLREDSPEIQSTTGPGNFSAALAAHALELQLEDIPYDFRLLYDWESIAEVRWELSYRSDYRNWRNVYGC